MTDTRDSKAREERNRERADKAFAEWKSQPLTRLSMSMIPAGEKADVLDLLLRSAFDAGVGCGTGTMAMEVVEGLMSREDRRRS
jgi:hypothetical protein